MSKSLLVADDSVTIQKAVGIVFAGEGYRVTAASDGEEALRLVREERPDVILADVSMPSPDGYQLCQALRGDPGLKDVPVLLLTGPSSPYDEARGLAAGADGALAKPFDSQTLLARVRELVEGVTPAPLPLSYPRAVPTPAPPPAPVLRPAPVAPPAAPIRRLVPPPLPPPGHPLRAGMVRPRPTPVAPPAVWAPAPPLPPPPPDSIEVAPPSPIDGGEAALRLAISQASREVVERIAWEVVPQLAEVIIREHVERLVNERQKR